jgi:hypothetical protein
MITFDIIPTIVSHTSKTRILNLWNLTASPSGCSITTQSPTAGERKKAGILSDDIDILGQTG